MAAEIMRNHLMIDVIEEGCLVTRDVQSPATHRKRDIGGFGALYADRKKDGASAGSTDAKIARLCTKILTYLFAEAD
jgi:hypothetical protein